VLADCQKREENKAKMGRRGDEESQPKNASEKSGKFIARNLIIRPYCFSPAIEQKLHPEIALVRFSRQTLSFLFSFFIGYPSDHSEPLLLF